MPIADFREHFSYLRRNQGATLGEDLTYSEFVKYVQGVDDATDVLKGFHDWLIARLGGGRSLFWSALVTFDALGVSPAHHSTDLPADWRHRVESADADLVQHLFELLDEFLSEPRLAD
jgi:hypothetical protein